MRFIYPAVIKKTGEEAYHAYLPDLTGCAATGDSIDEVLDNVNAAAYDWIMLELEDHDELPPVTDLRDIKLQEDEFVRNISIAVRFMEGWDE